MIKRHQFIGALLSLVVLAGTAHAELLDSTMTAYTVKQINSKETLVKADKADPGSIIEYHLTYTSNAKKPLSVQQISVPVPESTHYIPNSSHTEVTSQFQVSIDGGKSWDNEPVKRMRKTADGKMKEVIVPVSEYTHLRWKEKNPIDPGEVQNFTYRVQVL